MDNCTVTVTARVVRAPRGSSLHCLAWPQEAAFRMIQNNLDPDVAERPEDLIVYGGTGRAARSWAAFDRILQTLARLKSDETLLVQSGKPVGVFRTHEWAPRVLIANALIVPRWATWDEFRRLEGAGLTMYGQMTAGSWIYIGTQGILQGTFETFAAVAERHFAGSLDGYIPAGVGDPDTLRRDDPEEYKRRSRASIARHCEAIVALARRGAIAFDYGNNLRGEAQSAGFADAFSYPGFVSEYIRPLFAEGRGPFRWVALSGDESDIRRTDKLVLELFSENRTLSRWIRLAGERVPFQGLPARVCWLGYGERAKLGLRFNDMVRRGELKAPIVIGRDHLDAGSVASPNRETEAMKDGSDAIADWPILHALINTACGAGWVSVHHGGGVGIGYSLHAGMVVVADGSRDAEWRLERVLTSDPGMGVIRHVDAGYDEAVRCAEERDARA